MKPTLALLMSLGGSAAFVSGSWTVAVQDLDMRPVLLHRGSPDLLPEPEVVSRLEAAMGRGTGRADIPLLLGETLDRRGSAATPADGSLIGQAGELYRLAAVHFPAHALGQFRLSVALLREGREAEGRNHVRAAARCAGNHPALLEAIGSSYLSHWKRVRDPAALLDCLAYYRATVERDRGRLPHVLARLEPVLPDPADLASAVPDTPWARAAVAVRLEAAGKDAPAMEILEKLPSLDGPSADGAGYGVEVKRAHARILLRAGKTDEGLAALGRIRDASADADALAKDLEDDLAPVAPAVRARFLAAVATPGPRTRLAVARASRAAGDDSAALAIVNGLLAETKERTAMRRLVPADRAVLIACYEFRRDDWVRRGASLPAAAEAVEAARLDPVPGRWTAAARLFAEGGEAKEAAAAWTRALEAVPKDDPGTAAAIRAEMDERLAKLRSRR